MTHSYTPLQHAADTLLGSNAGQGLAAWLRSRADLATPVLVAELYKDTDGAIIVDRRTMDSWRKLAA